MNGTWTLSDANEDLSYPYLSNYLYKMVYLEGNFRYTEYLNDVKPRHIRRAKRAIVRRVRRNHATAEAIRKFNEAKEH